MKACGGASSCGWSVPFLTQTVLSLLGVVLHLWTALRVVRLGGGGLLGTVALFLPGLAEIAVGVVSCWTQAWGNPYCPALLLYACLLLADWLGLVLLTDFPDYEA